MRRFLPTTALALLLAACQPPPAAQPDPDSPARPAPDVASADPGPEAPPPGAVERTAEMPRFSAMAVDGTMYDLAAHRGRWVVVNFWATWCKPCLKEMPELSALHTMRDNIEVVGLAYEDATSEEMQAFLAGHPVSYPIVVLDPFSPPQDFATPRGLPMTYLLAPDGKVARQFLGPVTAYDIESAIASASGTP